MRLSAGCKSQIATHTVSIVTGFGLVHYSNLCSTLEASGKAYNSSDSDTRTIAVVSLDCTVTVANTGYVEFVATIEKDENGYIFVDSNNSVCLNDKIAYKFIYKTSDGGKCMFQHQESGMYLGYKDSNVCLVNYEYEFVRNPPKNYDDPGNSSISNLSMSG